MKLVGLISGGKDSIYNLLQCLASRHKIVALANMEPYKKEELDSYMYQSVGHEVISLIGSALGIPVYRQKTKGKAICQEKTYVATENDEVEDLLDLLARVKREVKIEGVSVGAIASDYQRTRVENVCSRLDLKCFAYLWKRDQVELLQEMIDANIEAIIIKVASIGLNPKTHLGMTLKEIQPLLLELHKKYGVNVCGEGGEYETLTLNCPLFNRSIIISSSENVILSNDAFAPVGFLKVTGATLSAQTSKDPSKSNLLQLSDNTNFILSFVRNPESYIDDCVNEVTKVIFPQKNLVRLIQELPLPFHAEEESEHDLTKKSTLSSFLEKNLTKETSYYELVSKKSHSQSEVSLLIDCSMYNLNYSTGWCCVGNVTGENLMEAMNNLNKYLKMLNFNIGDVVVINVYLKDMTKFNDINSVYSRFVPKTNPPVRSCIGTALPPGVDVILFAVAQKVVSKSKKFINANSHSNRAALQVQSISHWVPAAIGPYSHCVKVDEIYYLAGQIPLIPGSMEILNKPVLYQCKLTLRHVLRVLKSMDENFTFSNIFQAICYVVSREIAEDMYDLWSYLTEVTHATVTVVVVKALPYKAFLEWEVVACSSVKPLVDEKFEELEEVSVYMKRCFYEDLLVCSLLCKISNLESTSKKRLSKFPSVSALTDILVLCVNFLKKGFKESSPLCMFRVFYKSCYTGFPDMLQESLNGFKTVKIVATSIPVIACENSNDLITVTGICS